MPTRLQAHVQHTTSAVHETEEALCRWEDDGGPAFTPRTGTDQWLRIAAALSERLPELAGREDVIVRCEHGTRSGAPAAFFPARAELEIDAALFAPLAPATIDPLQPGDEERYRVAWGAFVHEAAHAAHSRWTAPASVRGTALESAAALLEESRAERAHLDRRPGDRRFLRAAIRTLVMDDITTATHTNPWQTAAAAALILARRDAGVLDEDETAALEKSVIALLGNDLLSQLAAIWTAAHTTGDTDEQTMLDHAQAWCDALGTDSSQPEPSTDSSIPGPGNASGGRTGELTDAVGEVVAAVEANEAAQTAADARAEAARTARKQAKAAQAAHARQTAQTAGKVFAPGARPYTPPEHCNGQQRHSPVTGTRQPTRAEKAAAGQLARALRAAAYRERATTVTAAPAPPGRLNMRQALARDAQKAAGAIPTATPWVRTVHRAGQTPPLRVGIAVDVSRSMDAATAPLASAAWIVAKATALTDSEARSATVTYDLSVTAITAPGRTPTRVTEFNATGRRHSLADATDALEAGLDLTRPGAGRLLVIASDGIYRKAEALPAAARIAALRKAGCAILWLAFAPEPRPLPGTTLLELTDPAHAATEIGKAATRALANTSC